jgi:HPr kinase/phosphorylase
MCASGSGKSTLIAQAMLHGASLIADDHVILRADGNQLLAEPAPELQGVLELRGLGIIQVAAQNAHPIHLAIELVADEIERLPAPKTTDFLSLSLPFITLPAAPHTPVASLLLYLSAMQEGRIFPQDWRPERHECSKPLQSFAVGAKSKP